MCDLKFLYLFKNECGVTDIIVANLVFEFFYYHY